MYAIRSYYDIPYTYGAGLRKGIEEEAEKAGLTTGFTLFKYFRDGKFIVGYDTTIAYYDIRNNFV